MMKQKILALFLCLCIMMTSISTMTFAESVVTNPIAYIGNAQTSSANVSKNETVLLSTDTSAIIGALPAGYVMDYQWYSSSNGTPSEANSTLIVGATGSTYTAPTDTAGTFYYYYRCAGGDFRSNVVTVTVTVTPSKTIELDISKGSVTFGLNDKSLAYKYGNNTWINYTSDDSIVIFGTTSNNNIIVESGSHRFTLRNVIIDLENTAGQGAIYIRTNQKTDILLSGTNTLKSDGALQEIRVADTSAPVNIIGTDHDSKNNVLNAESIANGSNGGLSITHSTYGSGGNVTVTNSTVTGNIANGGFGGNEYIGRDGGYGGNGGSVTITNSTVTGNIVNGGIGGEATDGIPGTGGFAGVATINNSTITGQVANGGAGGLFKRGDADNVIFCGSGGTGGNVKLSYSTINGDAANGGNAGIAESDGEFHNGRGGNAGSVSIGENCKITGKYGNGGVGYSNGINGAMNSNPNQTIPININNDITITASGNGIIDSDKLITAPINKLTFIKPSDDIPILFYGDLSVGDANGNPKSFAPQNPITVNFTFDPLMNGQTITIGHWISTGGFEYTHSLINSQGQASMIAHGTSPFIVIQGKVDFDKNGNIIGGIKSPQTGGNNNILLWIALLFVSGGAIGTLAITKKRNHK